MRRRYIVMPALFLLVVILASCSRGQSVVENQQEGVVVNGELVNSAKQFVEILVKEDYLTAVGHFDNTMKAALPEGQLKEAWESVIAQAGQFKRQIGTRTEKYQQYDIVYVACEFEKLNLDIKVVYNSDAKVSGLFFLPGKSSQSQAIPYQDSGGKTQAKWGTPSYVSPKAYKERDVLIGSGQWAVRGTLALPKGKGPFPAVVLVHGSGPNDRDESIGPNKPFKDIAWGLASKNIAVLRYEKRTKEHADKMKPILNKITVKEEVIDDGLAAVALLRKTKDIDSKRIILLGHSMGGMLAPKIGAIDGSISGFIIMAGPSRPLEDLILDQVEYLVSIDSTITPAEVQKLELVRRQVARVKDPELLKDTSPAEMLLGIHTRYWLGLRGYDPLEEAKKLRQPILILQGGRDYQVTLKDFAGWNKALSKNNNVTFKSYPKLNHLFIEGNNKSTPGEYQVPGNMAKVVIDDIANWVFEYGKLK